MYSYIIGNVVMTSPKYVVIENNQIGYEIMVGNPFYYKCGEQYKIFVYLNVREDIQELFGFSSIEQKDLFLKLISVKGIGPRTSLAIIASANVVDFAKAIDAGDVKHLMKYPGIGQKASQQIILDLKGKVNLDAIPKSSIVLDEVEEALIALGYNKKEVQKILTKLDQTKTTSELIKDALQLFMK